MDRDGQSGAALLAVTLVLSLGLAGLVLGARTLSPGEVAAWRAERTTRALASAKAALIGYAASYVEQHPPGPGPGYLPCPDVDGDGSPDPACPSHAVGWLPWRRLGLAEAVDGAGARLWYALGDPLRSNPLKHTPLNRTAATHLEDTGRNGAGGGLAAVVLAPGPPLGEQRRGAPVLDPGQYLEGANAHPGLGRFERAAGPRFNDRVIGLGVDTLMDVVEARVRVEVRRVLAAFRDAAWNPGRRSPWLRARSPSPDPARAEVGVEAGFLPVHRVGAAFSTGFFFEWEDAGAQGAGGASAGVRLTATVGESDGVCVWVALDVLWCRGRGAGRVAGGPAEPVDVAIRLRRAGEVVIAPPTAIRPRTRSVRVDGPLPPGSVLAVIAPPSVVYWAGPGDRVRLRVGGVRFALAPGLELPDWFTANDWHERARVTFSGPGGTTEVAVCVELPACDGAPR